LRNLKILHKGKDWPIILMWGDWEEKKRRPFGGAFQKEGAKIFRVII